MADSPRAHLHSMTRLWWRSRTVRHRPQPAVGHAEKDAFAAREANGR